MEQLKNSTRTVEEELSRERKFWRRNQICTVIVVIVVLVGLLGGSSISVAPQATALTMTMHDGSTEVLNYADIVSADPLEYMDYGTLSAGKETRQGRSGIWDHPQWGSYTLCAYASCESAIFIQTEDRCYVVNLPSREETYQLYQLLQDKIPASR